VRPETRQVVHLTATSEAAEATVAPGMV